MSKSSSLFLQFKCVSLIHYISDDKDKEDGDKKEKKDESKEGGARNLWVSGLSGDTRAKDLKQLCSKHGKVQIQHLVVLSDTS